MSSKEKSVFKDIPGYEGYYQVSTDGIVRSVDRIITIKKNNTIVNKPLKGRVIKSWKAQDYMHVTLSKNGKIKAPFVHKLVAQTFIPNPEGKKQVNHKDENKLNNEVSNLEWCDQLYNRNYGTGEQRRLESFMRSSESHNKKQSPVIQMTKKGETVKRYKSIKEAGDDGYNMTCITNCCKGKRKSHRGFTWKYDKK